MSVAESPQSILTLLDSIRTQIDVITTLSSGGLGVIILTWARILGIMDDADLSSFRRPGLLVLPALALLCAVILGYLAGAQTTGYFTEIANGVTAEGAKIECAKDHYFDDYDNKFYRMMQIQLYASVLGIVFIAAWFAWNVFANNRRKQ